MGVVDIILQHKSRVSGAVNEELLLTAWCVGSYVSSKFKTKNEEAKLYLSCQNINVLSALILRDVVEWIFITCNVLRRIFIRIFYFNCRKILEL